MRNPKKFLAVVIAVVLTVVLAVTLCACVTDDNLDEINSETGKVSSGNNSVSGEIVYNQYTVNTSTGAPAENATSYTEVIEAVQTSVVLISISTDLNTAPSAAGAGVFYGSIVGEDASMIITCCHVVEDAAVIKVTVNDGDLDSSNDVILDATVIGMDDDQDIAVLKVDGTGYNYATCRDISASPYLLGEDATAIGNPLGAGITVTKGIISGIERSVKLDGVTMTLLQTDAAVNGGNSGGALFDANGYLIGIVNAKTTGSAIDGVGYAIPISTAKYVADSIISTAGNPEYNGLGYIEGKIRLGVSIAQLNKATVESDFPQIGDLAPNDSEYYYYVSEVTAYGSIARSDTEGGIAAGTLITGVTVEGQERRFTDSYTIETMLAEAEIGDVVTFHIITVTVSSTGIFGPTTYTYAESSVDITMYQYVYGFIG